MIVRRIILCILGCILLLCSAVAETECQHVHIEEMATSHTVIVPLEAGHYSCKVTHTMCLDCKTDFVDRQYGHFVGHTFHIAESIHCQQEGRHLWVFLCSECMYITMREEECAGGENCVRYSPQAGEMPVVQLTDSLVAWKEENTKEVIVSRWLENEDNIAWLPQGTEE